MPRLQRPTDDRPGKTTWFGRIVGGTLLGLVMAVGLLEMTKSPEQRQRERERAELKIHCKTLREGLPLPEGADAESRRRLEESCRKLARRPGRADTVQPLKEPTPRETK
jgi:hypothetical protein